MDWWVVQHGNGWPSGEIIDNGGIGDIHLIKQFPQFLSPFFQDIALLFNESTILTTHMVHGELHWAIFTAL